MPKRESPSSRPAEERLARKWTFRSGQRQVVFVKGKGESTRHVLMKAVLWALYLPTYPELRVEVRIGDRFKPDLVALDDEGRPCFWGEAGAVSARKLASLFRRFRETPFRFRQVGHELGRRRADPAQGTALREAQRQGGPDSRATGCR